MSTTLSDTSATRLKSGQLRHLILATIASVFGFWGWTMIGPLSKYYAGHLHLSTGQIATLVAMPVIVGSVARIPAGALTDKYGGRLMFTVVLGLTAPLVLLTGLAGILGSYPLLLVVAFFLGVAGTVFSVGIPFSSDWYESHRKGFATGVFGAGMAGTAVSAFVTPRLNAAFGYLPTHVIVAVLIGLMAVASWIFLRDSPAWREREPAPMLPKVKHAFSLLVTYQMCFLYAIIFGAFVAFSNYLPTYLGNVYDFDATAAGTRTAGFALAAVIARPIGGSIADKIGPRLVTLVSFLGVIVFAAILAFQPTDERHFGPMWVLMALCVGLGTGGVFAWVSRAAPASAAGTISGVIAAAGGLGGYFPQLYMGATYNAREASYFVGLMTLAAFTLLGVILTLVMRRRGSGKSTAH